MLFGKIELASIFLKNRRSVCATYPTPQEQLERFKKQFLQLDAQGIEDLLPTEPLQRLLKDAEEAVPHTLRQRIWTPLVTLLALIKQALKHGSCSDAVKSVQTEQINCGQTRCSGNTSAYCQARQKLPESLPRELIRYTGERLEAASRTHWSWRGHPVKLVDGSTLTLADTCANQETYPQESNQQAGLGFPILRLEIVASLNHGGLLGAEVAPYCGKGTGETALLRRLMATTVQPHDICLMDQYYDNFWTIAQFRERDAELLCPMRSHRKIDWSQGVCLRGDSTDRLFELKKPKRPEWMTPETYEALADHITVRFFRIFGQTYMTTLVDAKHYRKNALRKLYRHRWQIEIDLLFIKKVMQMEPLRCKTPAMARKELTVCLLAYNLIRLLMLQAGIRHHVWPCRISFTEALGSYKEFASSLAQTTGETLLNWINNVLEIVASKTIGEREARIEPRAVKRRPTNPFPYLSAPRAQVKEQLLAKRKGDQIMRCANV